MTLIMFALYLCIFDPNTPLCNSYPSFFDEWILSVLKPGRSGSWRGSLDCGPYSGTMLSLNFEFLFNLTGSKGLRIYSFSTCAQLAPD